MSPEAKAPGQLSIVDSQIHMWANDTSETPWPQSGRAWATSGKVLSSAERKPFSAEELIARLDAAGVERAIIVPPVFAGNDSSVAIDAATRYPTRFWVMARVPIEEKAGRIELERQAGIDCVVGSRLTFFWDEHRQALDDGAVEWFWTYAEEHDIPVAVLAPRHTAVLGDVARRHPGLRLIIDHFGMDLELKDAAAIAGVEALLPLAELPNVAIKASTLPSYVSEPYPFPSLRDPIRRVVDAFGPSRVFWGSELTRLPVPYEDAIRQFTEGLDFLSDDDIAQIMGQGVRTWLRI